MIDGLDDTPAFGLAVRIMDSIDPQTAAQLAALLIDNNECS